MFSLENCCYLNKYIIYSGSCQKNCIGLQASAPTEQTLSLYCLNPPLLDSLLQRKLSRRAGMAWLKKDVFVFKLTEYFNAAFFQVVSVSELWAGANDLKTCGFTISSLLVVTSYPFTWHFSVFTHWSISVLIYSAPQKRGIECGGNPETKSGFLLHLPLIFGVTLVRSLTPLHLCPLSVNDSFWFCILQAVFTECLCVYVCVSASILGHI